MVNAIYQNMNGEKKDRFTVGINDDVTFHSLTVTEKIDASDASAISCKFYGLGSDGTVGANKNSIKIIGDHMSMYGVNASIPKTLIRWMIDAISEMRSFAASRPVLQDILDTPISPELLPPDAEGKIAQHTEDLVGPYALHDFYLYYTLRFGCTPRKVYALACRAFAGDFDGETIKKWLKTFYRRFFTQQFKRSCLPDGVKVGSVSLSPRGDWRMPSDASARLWLEEVDSL